MMGIGFRGDLRSRAISCYNCGMQQMLYLRNIITSLLPQKSLLCVKKLTLDYSKSACFKGFLISLEKAMKTSPVEHQKIELKWDFTSVVNARTQRREVGLPYILKTETSTSLTLSVFFMFNYIIPLFFSRRPYVVEKHQYLMVQYPTSATNTR